MDQPALFLVALLLIFFCLIITSVTLYAVMAEEIVFKGRRRVALTRVDEETPLIISSSHPSYPAWLGDALHKMDVRVKLGTVDGESEIELTSNRSQKEYLCKYHPELIQGMQGRSEHSFGTLFEIHYWSEKKFRALYLTRTFKGFGN